MILTWLSRAATYATLKYNASQKYVHLFPAGHPRHDMVWILIHFFNLTKKAKSHT